MECSSYSRHVQQTVPPMLVQNPGFPCLNIQTWVHVVSSYGGHSPGCGGSGQSLLKLGVSAWTPPNVKPATMTSANKPTMIDLATLLMRTLLSFCVRRHLADAVAYCPSSGEDTEIGGGSEIDAPSQGVGLTIAVRIESTAADPTSSPLLA